MFSETSLHYANQGMTINDIQNVYRFQAYS
jgi:hypothetical protein